MRRIVSIAAAAIACIAQTAVAIAQQTDLTVPGGATGSNVSCLQAGDLSSGIFVGTYLETGPKAWEERLKTDTFKLEERSRDDLVVELFDPKRQASIRFDFVNRTVKYKLADAKGPDGDDRYYILNATDKAGSKDCTALAEGLTLAARGGTQAEGGSGPSGPGTGGGAGGAGSPGAAGAAGPTGAGPTGASPAGASPPNPTVVVVIPPRTQLNVAPGTLFTAIRGPQCPGHPPGWFICPNQFTCAPPGGVCCPGLGACSNGTFCDQFVPASCIGPGNPRFCGATANANTGIGLHCAPGETCVNNLCY